VSLTRAVPQNDRPVADNADDAPGSGYLGEVWQRLRASNPARVGFVIIALFVFLAVFAPLVSPYGPLDQTLVQRLKGPSAEHIFGTDNLGRDVFSRVLLGSRAALAVAMLVVSAAMLIGVPLGLVAGYHR
jgi:ABC-type dipeptide/oligopeptide/nickel transport system permease subunit